MIEPASHLSLAQRKEIMFIFIKEVDAAAMLADLVVTLANIFFVINTIRMIMLPLFCVVEIIFLLFFFAGAQPISIGPGCEYTGIVVHELMHAAGFFHEQSRYDREDYVTIYFNNIQDGMEFNFQRYSWKDAQNLSMPYDLNSVMHYGPYAFSKYQGRPTILPKDPNKTIGQRRGFSALDVQKVNSLYKCGTSKPTTTTPAPTTKPPVTCNDYHRHCSYWAKRGECTRNPAWMKANCRSSCSQCSGFRISFAEFFFYLF